MLMPILIAIDAIIVVFVIVVAMRPDDFRVMRTATLSAPPAMVFAQVNDFHKWEAWSPWAKLDPAARIPTKVRQQEPERSSVGPATTRSVKGA